MHIKVSGGAGPGEHDKPRDRIIIYINIYFFKAELYDIISL